MLKVTNQKLANGSVVVEIEGELFRMTNTVMCPRDRRAISAKQQTILTTLHSKIPGSVLIGIELSYKDGILPALQAIYK